jgi:membrane protease YdiL (CAAX protease family)/menaquinone-dependent protoporphyrinogen IX oxidase
VSGPDGLRDLLRRTVAWRGRLRWLALALLGPLVLFGIAALAVRLLNGEWPDLGRFAAGAEYPALPLAGYWIANLIFYGYGEEIGWRGFLQPALQRRRSALTAATLVSLVWAGWHLPLFGITAGYRSMPPVAFAGFYLSILVAALVMAWLYLRSNGSLLVLAVFHATYDITTNTPTTTTLIPTLMGAAITVAGLAIIPALATVRPAHRGPSAPGGETPPRDGTSTEVQRPCWAETAWSPMKSEVPTMGSAPEMSVLVSAASKHGSTGEIADRVAGVLRTALPDGAVVDVRSAAETADPASYDAVVLGSAVYMGHWMQDARLAAARIAARPPRWVWLFSSGPVGDPPKPDEDPVDVRGIVTATNARGHRLFAGRLDRHRLGYAEKAMVLALRVPDGDFRDWDAIDSWARQIAAELCAPSPIPAPHSAATRGP